MPILTVIAVLTWVGAAILLIAGLTEGDLIIVAGAIATAITGVLFFAFSRVIALLTEIRNAISGNGEEDRDRTINEPLNDEELSPATQALQDDLDRIKSGLPPIDRPG